MEIDRIIVDTGHKEGKNRVVANLVRCPECGVNFTMKPPCIMCEVRLSLKKKLGRDPTGEEFWKEMKVWGLD